MDFVVASGFDLRLIGDALKSATIGYSGGRHQLRRIGQLAVFSSDPTAVNGAGSAGENEPASHYLFDGQFSVGSSYFHALLARDTLRSRIDGLMDGLTSPLEINAGVFVAGRIDHSGLVLRTDPIGQYPLYFTRVGERFIVANAVRLISTVLQAAGLPATPSLLPCIEGIVLGGSIGDTTPVNGVSRVPFGHRVVARPHLSFVPEEAPDHGLPYDEVISRARRALGAHVEAAAAAVTGSRYVIVDLTGGSDTRAVLSLLLPSRLRREMRGWCLTRLPHPDANVATMLMTRYRIPVGVLPTVIDSLEPPSLASRQSASLTCNAAFSGGARMPDGPLPSIATPGVMHFTGCFGEIAGATPAIDFIAMTESQGYSSARAAAVMVGHRRGLGLLDLVTADGQNLVERKAAALLAELEAKGTDCDHLQSEFYLRTRCRDHFGSINWLANKTRIRPDPLASLWLVAARRGLPRRLHRQNKVILDLILAGGPEGAHLAFLPMADKHWHEEIVPAEHLGAWRRAEVVTPETPKLAPGDRLREAAPVASAAVRDALEDPATRIAYLKRRREVAQANRTTANVRFGNEATISVNQAIGARLLDATPAHSDAWQLLDRKSFAGYVKRPTEDFRNDIQAASLSQAVCGLTWLLERPTPEAVKELGEVFLYPIG